MTLSEDKPGLRMISSGMHQRAGVDIKPRQLTGNTTFRGVLSRALTGNTFSDVLRRAHDAALKHMHLGSSSTHNELHEGRMTAVSSTRDSLRAAPVHEDIVYESDRPTERTMGG